MVLLGYAGNVGNPFLEPGPGGVMERGGGGGTRGAPTGGTKARTAG